MNEEEFSAAYIDFITTKKSANIFKNIRLVYCI